MSPAPGGASWPRLCHRRLGVISVSWLCQGLDVSCALLSTPAHQGCKYFRKCPRLFDRDPGHMCSEDNYHWLASLSSSSWLPRCDAGDDEVVTPVITEPCVPPRVMIHNWSHDWELLAQDPARPRRSRGAGQELRKLTRPGPGLHHAHSVLRAHATSPALWLAHTMWYRPLIGPAGMVMHWWTNFPANSRSLWSDRGGAARGLTMCPVSARQWSLLTALATCHGKSCHFWNPAIPRPGPILTGHTALSESIIIPNGSQTSPCQCINELIRPPQ